MISGAGLAHIGIHVAAVAPMYEWYREHFGFEQVMRFPSAELPVPLIADSGSEILIMNNGLLTIELIANVNHTPHPMRGRSHIDAVTFGGLGHLCFEVDDCFAVAARLEAEGVPIALGPNSWPELGFSTAHLHDIEGNDLEILSYHGTEDEE